METVAENRKLTAEEMKTLLMRRFRLFLDDYGNIVEGSVRYKDNQFLAQSFSKRLPEAKDMVIELYKQLMDKLPYED